MRHLAKILLACLAVCGANGVAKAQTGTGNTWITVACPSGTPIFTAGKFVQTTAVMDVYGSLCINGNGGGASTVSQGAAGSASNAWFFQPGTGATFTNPSIGANGATAPSSSTQIAGPDSVTGNLTAVQTSSGAAVVTQASGSTLNVNTVAPTPLTYTGSFNTPYSTPILCTISVTTCSYYTLTLSGQTSIGVNYQITTGGIQVYGSVDCNNWTSAPLAAYAKYMATAQASVPQAVSSVQTSNYIYEYKVAGLACLQFRQNGGTFTGSPNTYQVSAIAGPSSIISISGPVLTEPPYQTFSFDLFGLTGSGTGGTISGQGDAVVLTSGSSRVVRLLEVRVSCTATAATTIQAAVIRRTAADTGGTSNAVTTPTVYTPGQAAVASTAVSYYGSPPTAGGSNSMTDAFALPCSAGSAGLPTSGGNVEIVRQYGPAGAQGYYGAALAGINPTSFALYLASIPTGFALNLHEVFSEQYQ